MSKKFSEDYLDGYKAGLAFMLRSEREYQRLAAFGAIRRAVEMARNHDKVARHYAWEGDPQAHVWRTAAISIRRAIRAAIGSEKT